MNNQTVTPIRELRPNDADRVDELFPSARRRELLQTIVGRNPAADSPAQRDVARGGRRPAAARYKLRRPAALSAFGAAAAAIAAAVLSATSAVSPGRAQAVAFRTAPGGDIIATVTDPLAAQAQLDAAFAQQGLKITVTLLPVSPSIVGTVVSVGESGPGMAQIKPLQGGHCLSGGGGCAIGIDIPRDFHGEGSIYLGRPAKPGEPYESGDSAFAPGEPLHCSGLLGARVAAALPALEAKHFTVIQWQENVEDSPTSSHTVDLAQPPARNHIWGADLTEAGKVTVTTAPTPWPDNPGAGSEYNRGC
ncbi:MAG TPA: hypothetical protein VNV42_05210 [Solirubrobacteraceae bacterium]|jgi:hypothetical protein|nr:hypothetical protein [Solirubrobacteraceae bacterium]